MEHTDTAVAIFDDHQGAEGAVKTLAGAGFAIANLSIVGKGYHTDEKVVGFYNTGDRIRFWGTRGALWGGLWTLFFGGIFLTIPMVGSLVVLGHVAATLIVALENAVVVGGLSALGAALYGIGIPKDTIVQYEAALKADRFLVMAHGTAEEVARAKALLAAAKPWRMSSHKVRGASTDAAAPVSVAV